MQGGFPRRKKDIHRNSHKFKEGAEYAMSGNTFDNSDILHTQNGGPPKTVDTFKPRSPLKKK